jgi:hypothetical protein
VRVNDVAEVDVGLPRVERFLTDAVQADHHLQRGPVALLQRGETQLSGVARKHHPACDTDDLAGLGIGLQIWVGLPDLGQRVGAGNLNGVRLAAVGKQPLPLALTDPELLGDIGLVVGLIR